MSGGNGELYGELKGGECLRGEQLERIAAKRPPRAVDGGERVSEAAPTTALAASSRGCALLPRVPVSAGAACVTRRRREFSRDSTTTSGQCGPGVLLAVVMGSKINVHAGAHDEQAGTSWPNLALTSAVRH